MCDLAAWSSYIWGALHGRCKLAEHGKQKVPPRTLPLPMLPEGAPLPAFAGVQTPTVLMSIYVHASVSSNCFPRMIPRAVICADILDSLGAWYGILIQMLCYSQFTSDINKPCTNFFP